MPGLIHRRASAGPGPAWALLAAVVWALTMIVMARLVDTLTPPTVACVRLAVTTLLLGAWLSRRGQLPKPADIGRRDRGLLLLAAAGLAANYVLSMQSLSHVTPAESSVLSSMNGMLLMGCGLLFLGERLSRLQAAGLVTFLVGQGLFLLPRLTASTFDRRFALGALLVMLAAFAWLAYALVQRVVQRRLNTLQVLWLVCGGAALVLLPFSSLQGFDRLGAGGWLALAVACLCTLVAYGAFAQAMRHWTVSGATTVTSLSPVLVWLMSLLAAAMGLIGVSVPDVGALAVGGALLAVAGSALAALGRGTPPSGQEASTATLTIGRSR